MSRSCLHQLKRFGAIVLASITLLTAPAVLAIPAPAAVQRCTTAGLDVWLNSEGSGAAGSIYYKLEFTNLSGHACSLTGFPGVSATNLRGGKIGKAAVRDTSQPPGLVILADGATATATLRIVEAGNFPAATCDLETAAGLRVFPPGTTNSRPVPFPFQTCAKTGPAVLAVRALAKT